jgi:hypothetical protein
VKEMNHGTGIEFKSAQDERPTSWSLLLFSYWPVTSLSVATLLGYFPEPRETTVGLILIVASAIVMTILYFKKMADRGENRFTGVTGRSQGNSRL